MKITFLNFKLFLGTKVLERILKKENTRNVQSCNIEDAKSMGMLCVIKNENDYESTVQIIKLIKAEYKIPNIKILAFYPLKNMSLKTLCLKGLIFF
jgi:predicted type IV restriction endonuclease